MNSSTLSRRGFLQRTGTVVVGFSMTATLSELARGAPPAGGSLAADSWVVVSGSTPGGTGTLVTIYAGKVELGTGIQTALSQIVAEELNVDLSQVAYVQGDTDLTPGSQGYTAGSKSIQNDGPPMRLAAATAMQALMSLAASQFNVDASQLQVNSGRIGIGQTSTGGKTYGDLIGGQRLQLTSSVAVPLKSPSSYRIVGQPAPRMDLPPKFKATFSYAADVTLPGMLYARMVRPSGRNASFAGFAAGADAALAAIPGFVRKIQQGNFIAVVASEEYAAIAAQRLLSTGPMAVVWTPGQPLIAQAALPGALVDPANVYAHDYEVNVGNVDTALTTAGKTAAASYFTPFYMHGAVGPAVAAANWDGQRLTVWSATQGPYPLRAAIAALVGLPLASVHVIYVEGPGCYGHNPADDVAAEAALIAYLLGQPVRLQWNRAEEHGWEPLSSAMVHAMRGGVTGAGVVAWEHAVYSASHNARPGAGGSAGNLLAAQYIGRLPAAAPALGANTATRNAPVNYAFQNNRLIRNFVRNFVQIGTTTAPQAPLTWLLPRTTALRSLGGFSNSFANESFMDELARLAGADPLVFRLAHTNDGRAAAVLQAAAAQAGWSGPLAGAPTGYARGRGLACLRYETVEAYVATVVEVLVNTATGAVQVTRVVVAHDCGLIINPDGLRNQIEGNVMQGISRTLKEQVDYVGDHVTNNGWNNFSSFVHGYPVIQFNEVPAVEIVLIDQPNAVAWGAGEATIGTLPGAIANAVANAVGKRVRSLPMTPAAVLQAPAA